MLTPGVGYTAPSRITHWKDTAGVQHTGTLNPAAVLDDSKASVSARYGAGAGDRWVWTLANGTPSADNENAGNIIKNALLAHFAAGTLGSPAIFDGNPTLTEVTDACATGDPNLLAWAMEVPADTEPVPMDLPGMPCGVFMYKIPGTPFTVRPVRNTSALCVPVGAAPPLPAPEPPSPPAPPAPVTPEPPVAPPAPITPVYQHSWLARVPLERMVAAFGGRVAWPYAAVVLSHGLEGAALATWLLHIDAAGEEAPIFSVLKAEFGGS